MLFQFGLAFHLVAYYLLCGIVLSQNETLERGFVDRCKITISGCICRDVWEFDNRIYRGCSNPDDDVLGAWCVVERGCPAEDFIGIANQADGVIQRYDYCTPPCQYQSSQPKDTDCRTSNQGCMCLGDWNFAGSRNLVGCANPDNDPLGPWCLVYSKTCKPFSTLGTAYTYNPRNSYAYDYCPYSCIENSYYEQAVDQLQDDQSSEQGIPQTPLNISGSTPILEDTSIQQPLDIPETAPSLEDTDFQFPSNASDSAQNFENAPLNMSYAAPISEEAISILQDNETALLTIPVQEEQFEVGLSSLENAPINASYSAPISEEAIIILQDNETAPLPVSVQEEQFEIGISSFVADTENQQVLRNNAEIPQVEESDIDIEEPVLSITSQVPQQELQQIAADSEPKETAASVFIGLEEETSVINLPSPIEEIQFDTESDLIEVSPNLPKIQYLNKSSKSTNTNAIQEFTLPSSEQAQNEDYNSDSNLDYDMNQFESGTLITPADSLLPFPETESVEVVRVTFPVFPPVEEDGGDALLELGGDDELFEYGVSFPVKYIGYQYSENYYYTDTYYANYYTNSYKDSLDYNQADKVAAAQTNFSGVHQRYYWSYGAANLVETDNLCSESRAGCECLPVWTYDADRDGIMAVFRGCIQTKDARNRAWCPVNRETCRTVPASESGVKDTRTDIPWDFCPKKCTPTRRGKCTETVNNCQCRLRWEYEGLLQQGCTKPDGSAAFSWCVVRDGCENSAGFIAPPYFNQQWDICAEQC